MTVPAPVGYMVGVDSAYALSPEDLTSLGAQVAGVYIGGSNALRVWTPAEIAALESVVQGYFAIFVPGPGDLADLPALVAAALDTAGFAAGSPVVLDMEGAVAAPKYRAGLTEAVEQLANDRRVVQYPDSLAPAPLGRSWRALWIGSSIPTTVPAWPPNVSTADAWQFAGDVSMIDGHAIDLYYIPADFPLAHLEVPVTVPTPAPAFTTDPQVPGEPPGVPPVQDQSADPSFPAPKDAAAIIAAVASPRGGFWLVRQDGAVDACDGAPFHGSWGTLPASTRAGITPDFVAAVGQGQGYVLVHAAADPTTGAGFYRFGC